MGWDWMGSDGEQKCPLIFLRYIKHYTHINLYIYKWVLNIGQVGGPNKKIQKYTLWIILKTI